MASSAVGLSLREPPPSFKVLTPLALPEYLTLVPASDTEDIIKTQTLLFDKDTQKATRLSRRQAVFADPSKAFVRHPMPNREYELVVAIACEYHYRDRARLRKDEQYKDYHIDSTFRFSFCVENKTTVLIPIIHIWRKTC